MNARVLLSLLLLSIVSICLAGAFISSTTSGSGVKHLTNNRRSPHNSFLKESSSSMEWQSLELTDFREGSLLDGKSQAAKDNNYLNAVMKLWNAETRKFPVERARLVCYDETKTPLYGHVIRRRRSPHQDKNDNSNQFQSQPIILPGILLFHTAAGPQDVALFYKADVLAQEMDCVVMICDILSDETGWAWGADRTHYNQVRESLLFVAHDDQNDHDDHVNLLQSRVRLAAETLCERLHEVDSSRLAAMGWCLGGQPILELARIRSSRFSIKAMSTFHGVFRRDGLTDTLTSNGLEPAGGQGAEILICNGKEDPFVSEDDLDVATKFFESNGHTDVQILQFEGAKHGFSNPAQDFNENPAFGYNADAAIKSWFAAVELLKRTLL